MAMVSDCLHHVYEALRCFEKRKVIVGFNLLRKPLTESLFYLSWMCGLEDDFYSHFTDGDPQALTLQALGARRKEIYSAAANGLKHSYMFDSESLENAINSKRDSYGFQMLFQRAVHLVTTWNPKIKTEAENFNFIFKNPIDDDVYYFLSEELPIILLFMSHVIIELFNRMEKMDELSKQIFEKRTVFSYLLIAGADEPRSLAAFEDMLPVSPRCVKCSRDVKITVYNATRMLLRSEFRCTICGILSPYPWLLYPEITEGVAHS